MINTACLCLCLECKCTKIGKVARINGSRVSAAAVADVWKLRREVSVILKTLRQNINVGAVSLLLPFHF
jgi:hypothetical protein